MLDFHTFCKVFCPRLLLTILLNLMVSGIAVVKKKVLTCRVISKDYMLKNCATFWVEAHPR